VKSGQRPGERPPGDKGGGGQPNRPIGHSNWQQLNWPWLKHAPTAGRRQQHGASIDPPIDGRAKVNVGLGQGGWPIPTMSGMLRSSRAAEESKREKWKAGENGCKAD